MNYTKYLLLIAILLISNKSFCAAAADVKQIQEVNKYQTQFMVDLGNKIVIDGDGLTLKLFFKDNGVDHYRVLKIKSDQLLKVHSVPNYYLMGFSVSFSINKIKFATNVLNFKFMYGRKFIINFPFTDQEGEMKIANAITHGINKLTIPAIGLIVKSI